MSEIDFGDGSWEDARQTIQNTLQELVNIVKGNGKEGMQTTLTTLATTIETTEKTRQEFQDKRDKEIKDSLDAHNKEADKRSNKQALIISLIGLIVACLDLYHTFKH